MKFFKIIYLTDIVVMVTLCLNLLINETIELPIAFIVGTSFIFGSLMGNLLVLEMNNE